MRLFLIVMTALSLYSTASFARDRIPVPAHAGLTAAWNLVACGERYKQVWFGGSEVRGAGKTYAELIQSYDQVPTGNGCTRVNAQGQAFKHVDYFQQAAIEFKNLIATNLTGKNIELAQWGLQELSLIHI